MWIEFEDRDVRHYFLAPILSWLGTGGAFTSTVLPAVATVASVASTAYSVYSSEQAESEAEHKEHKAERAAAAAQTAAQMKFDASAAGAAGLSEATRIRKRRAMASTIKTSPEGLTEAPTVGKQTLGD